MDNESLSKLSPFERKFLRAQARADAEGRSQPSESSRPARPATTPHFPWPMDNTRKGWYFCFGILMDPSTMAGVLQIAKPPRSHPARVIGYETRLWGPYPPLIDGKHGQLVEGIASEILSQNQVDRPIAYETSKYFIRRCTVALLDVGVGRQARSFDGMESWMNCRKETSVWENTCERRSWGLSQGIDRDLNPVLALFPSYLSAIA